jgi:hypothetical protein
MACFSDRDVDFEDTTEEAAVKLLSNKYLGGMTQVQLESLLCIREFFLERVERFSAQVEDDCFEDYCSLVPHPFDSGGDSCWERDDYFFSMDIRAEWKEAW